jgi:hypothetical protein
MMWALIAGTILGFAVVYSLVGRMTGVYRFPELDELGPARGYLVSDGERWLYVMLWNGRERISGRVASDEHTTVNSGVWIKEITYFDSEGSMKLPAYTPMDLIDVYALRIGHLSEEIKKLGPDWSNSLSTP